MYYNCPFFVVCFRAALIQARRSETPPPPPSPMINDYSLRWVITFQILRLLNINEKTIPSFPYLGSFSGL